ncbi:MAG: TRAP transporter large permease [Deltaproteobacteria bacterium]|nr:TRAP transporter large permease [Deltaproteobacteria bacterium]
MSPELVGVLGIAALFILFALGLPIAFSLGIVGFAGFSYLTSWHSGLSILGMYPFSTTASYTMSIIALFVLMGEFVLNAGLGEDIYTAIRQWMGHLSGGLAMATVGGCTLFGCVTGSSVATVATIGRVSLPEMKRYGYDDAISTGSIAAGGGLGMLIPPSFVLVIYGVITTQSIGKLLIAGVLPGLLLAFTYMAIIYIRVKLNPAMGPRTPKVGLKEKLQGLKAIWGIIVLFILIVGGIYYGIFTPTEAAGIGAFGTLLFAMGRRRLNWKSFYHSLIQATGTTVMILLIMIGATLFGAFLTVSNLPALLVETIEGLELHRYVILAFLLGGYMILGCFMEALSMMLVTVPIIFPLILKLGFDPIWFGVIILLGQEMAMITPPLGLNVFVMAGVAKDVPMYTIFKGIIPFLFGLLFCFIILIIFPQIVLVLPNMMSR